MFHEKGLSTNVNPAIAKIPARSRRQAMDWSLVLASQAIQCVLEPPDAEGGWRLAVAAEARETALAAIELYRQENRWPWQRRVLPPALLFHWGSLIWVVLLLLFFWVNETRLDLERGGMMDSQALTEGQWWRPFTAVWLHADAAHLAANATLGVVFLGLVMGFYGNGTGLLAAYLAGAAGNLFAAFLSSSVHRSLGASGMVMGALGLLTMESFSLWRTTPQARKLLASGLMAGAMLFVLVGLNPDPNTDLGAHIGGFLAGLIFGAALVLVQQRGRLRVINSVAGCVFALLLIWPWWLAIKQR